MFLQNIFLYIKVKKCGLDFRWSMFGLTEKDADNIGTGLEQINKIKLISIQNSKVRILKFYLLKKKESQMVSLSFVIPSNILWI